MNKEFIIDLLLKNDRAVGRALVCLSALQTEDEKKDGVVKYNNGAGFRPCHARIGVSMADFFTQNGFLTKKQIDYWRQSNEKGKMRIEIYAGQLLKIAEAKAGV